MRSTFRQASRSRCTSRGICTLSTIPMQQKLSTTRIWEVHTALIKSTLRLATLGVFGTLLASCGNLREPKDGRTMRDIYDEQMTGGGSAAYSPSQATGSSRPAEDAVPPRYSAYTRSVMTETENLFPTLPNPTLFLYIRPHPVGEDQIRSEERRVGKECRCRRTTAP